MTEELKKLNEYTQMGSNLPKSDFATTFKKIIRNGNQEEVKNAYLIINTLAQNPDLEVFVSQGLGIYKQIQKSHMHYDNLLQAIQISPQDITKISLFYSKINDSFFLNKANELLSRFPSLASIIRSKNEKEEVSSYAEKYSYVFDKYNSYILGKSYSTEKTEELLVELAGIRQLVMQSKDIDEEKRKYAIREIDEATFNLDKILKSMKEEEEMWAR